MGQEAIYNLLKREDRELSAKDISIKLNERYQKVTHLLSRMINKDITARELTKKEIEDLSKKYPKIKHACSVRVYRIIK